VLCERRIINYTSPGHLRKWRNMDCPYTILEEFNEQEIETVRIDDCFGQEEPIEDLI
jgi:hypothetical protein